MIPEGIHCIDREIDWLLQSGFFQAEDGIRDAQESRGLGDVFKGQSDTDVLSHQKGSSS